jgi:hypothetical protein
MSGRARSTRRSAAAGRGSGRAAAEHGELELLETDQRRDGGTDADMASKLAEAEAAEERRSQQAADRLRQRHRSRSRSPARRQDINKRREEAGPSSSVTYNVTAADLAELVKQVAASNNATSMPTKTRTVGRGVRGADRAAHGEQGGGQR